MLVRAHADPGTPIPQRRWRITGFIKLDQVMCSPSLVLQHWKYISSPFIHLAQYPWVVHWLALLSSLPSTVVPANSEQTLILAVSEQMLLHPFLYHSSCHSRANCWATGCHLLPLTVTNNSEKRQLSNLVMHLTAWIMSPGLLISYAMLMLCCNPRVYMLMSFSLSNSSCIFSCD